VRLPTVLAVLAAPLAASAGEGESSLSAIAGFASFTVNQTVSGRGLDRSGAGASLTVDFQHGIGDTFWVRASAGGGGFAAEGQAAWAGTGSVALVYAVDVLRYVPYISLGGGAVVLGGGALQSQARPFVELGVGLEVEQSPSFAWGLDARLGSFVTQATMFTIGPRVAFKWGYF